MKTSRMLLALLFLLLLTLAISISHEYRSCEWKYKDASLVGVWSGKVTILKDDTLLVLNITNGKVLKEFPSTKRVFLLENTLSIINASEVLSINLDDFTITKLGIPEGVDLTELAFAVNLGNISLYSTLHSVGGKYNFEIIEYYVCTENCLVYPFKVPPNSYPLIYTFPGGYVLTFKTNDAFTNGSAVVLNKNGGFMWNVTTRYAISDFEYSNNTLFFSTGGTEPGGTLITGGDIYAFSLNGSLKWHINLRNYEGKFYDWGIAGMKAHNGDLYVVGYTGRIYIIDSKGKLKKIVASPVYKRLKTPSLIKDVKVAKDDLIAFAYLDIKTSSLFRKARGICAYDFKNFKCWKTKERISRILVWDEWVIREDTNGEVCAWKMGVKR